MTEQETINNELQMKIALQDAKFNHFMEEMQSFKQEMKDFKTEMRDRDNQRHAEIAELRNDIKEINKSTDAKISEIRNSIDSMGKHVRNLAITAMTGIIAATIGIAAMVVTVISSR